MSGHSWSVGRQAPWMPGERCGLPRIGQRATFAVFETVLSRRPRRSEGSVLRQFSLVGLPAFVDLGAGWVLHQQ